MAKPKQREVKEAQLSTDQMARALPILERRIKELEEFDVTGVPDRYHPSVQALVHKYDDTLVDIFGKETVEYERYRIGSFDTAPMQIGTQQPMQVIHEGLRKGIERGITYLKTIKELFQEKIGDLGVSPSGRALISLDTVDLHPQIKDAVYKLFKDGHYANAIEDGCKTLELLVKIKSGRHDLSGTDLMHQVFSHKNPILKFNDLKSETDSSEQQGMMFLYAGAMLALRNPRAHQLIQDHPEKAFALIVFINHLAKTLDDTHK